MNHRDIGGEILEGLEQAVAYMEGEESSTPLRVHQVNLPPELEIDVVAIRRSLNLSQADFAQAYGFSVHSVRNWEQGVRTPERSTQLFLAMIRDLPEVVNRYLLKLGEDKALSPPDPRTKSG